MQVAVVVVLGEETRFAIVTALHDMQRNVVYVDARAAGHAETLAEFTIVRKKLSLALSVFY